MDVDDQESRKLLRPLETWCRGYVDLQRSYHHTTHRPLSHPYSGSIRTCGAEGMLICKEVTTTHPQPPPPPFTPVFRFDTDWLYATFECRGEFKPPRHDTTLARWERKEGVLESQQTLLADDSVALFVWPVTTSSAPPTTLFFRKLENTDERCTDLLRRRGEGGAHPTSVLSVR